MITKDVIIQAIRNTKGGKIPGPEEISLEVLRLIEEDSIVIVVDLFDRIYVKQV